MIHLRATVRADHLVNLRHWLGLSSKSRSALPIDFQNSPASSRAALRLLLHDAAIRRCSCRAYIVALYRSLLRVPALREINFISQSEMFSRPYLRTLLIRIDSPRNLSGRHTYGLSRILPATSNSVCAPGKPPSQKMVTRPNPRSTDSKL
jgi:hypothetical protein